MSNSLALGGTNRIPIVNEVELLRDSLGFELRENVVKSYMRNFPVDKYPYGSQYSWPSSLWSNFTRYAYSNPALGPSWLQSYLPIIGTDSFANTQLFFQPTSYDLQSYLLKDDIIRDFTQSKYFLDSAIDESVKVSSEMLRELPIEIIRGKTSKAGKTRGGGVFFGGCGCEGGVEQPPMTGGNPLLLLLSRGTLFNTSGNYTSAQEKADLDKVVTKAGEIKIAGFDTDPYVRELVQQTVNAVYGYTHDHKSIAAGITITAGKTTIKEVVDDVATKVDTKVTGVPPPPPADLSKVYRTKHSKTLEIYLTCVLAKYAGTCKATAETAEFKAYKELLNKLPGYRMNDGSVDRTSSDVHDGILSSTNFTITVNDKYNDHTWPGETSTSISFGVDPLGFLRITGFKDAYTVAVMLVILDQLKDLNKGHVFRTMPAFSILGLFSNDMRSRPTYFKSIPREFYDEVYKVIWEVPPKQIDTAKKNKVSDKDEIVFGFGRICDVVCGKIIKDLADPKTDNTTPFARIFAPEVGVKLTNGFTKPDHSDIENKINELKLAPYLLKKVNVLECLYSNGADNILRGLFQHSKDSVYAPGKIPHYQRTGFFYEPKVHNQVILDARKTWNQSFASSMNMSFAQGTMKVLELYDTAHMRNKMFFSENYHALKPLHANVSHTMFYSDFMRFVGSRQTSGMSVNNDMVGSIYGSMFPGDVDRGLASLLDPRKTNLNVGVIQSFVNSPYMLFNASSELDKASPDVWDTTTPQFELAKRILA